MAAPPKTVVEFKKLRRSMRVLQWLKDGRIVVNQHVRIVTRFLRTELLNFIKLSCNILMIVIGFSNVWSLRLFWDLLHPSTSGNNDHV